MDMAHFSLSTSNSSIYPLFLQTQFHFPFKVSKNCCYSRSLQVNAAKTNRKPRPSFYEQIQEKWSLKVPSTREKFPWQEQTQQSHEETQTLAEAVSSEAKVGDDNSVSISLPKNIIKAPWMHGNKQKRPQFDSETKIVENVELNDVVDNAESVDRRGNFDPSDDILLVDTVDRLVKYEKVKYEIGSGVSDGQIKELYNVLSDGNVDRLPKKVNYNEKHEKVKVEVDVCGGVPIEFRRGEVIVGAKNLKNSSLLNEKPFEGNVDNVERFLKDANNDDEFKESKVEIGDGTSIELEKDAEITRTKDSNDSLFRNEKFFSDNGVFKKVETSSLVELPWERKREVEAMEGGERRKRSKTELAEKMLPDHELKRLRNVALRMYERIKVGAAGITQDLVAAIHEKWKLDEVVKLKFEEPLSCNMARTHAMLESRTGGLVIWRSGSSVVLYRGTSYKLDCVRSFSKQNEVGKNVLLHSEEGMGNAANDLGVRDSVGTPVSYIPYHARYLKDLSQEELTDFSELNQLLDELGPRFEGWCGREPFPVDADLLPALDSEFKPPFRLLPYGLRHCLRNKEMTIFRRLARTTPPHFALGRNRQLQGLAKAIVKLWEKSAIAKIAIKRGVQNTRNERMAEELKVLTGGTLLSRNKEYIVFYRGNDFLPPAIMETLKERKKLTYLKQDEEEQARQAGLASVESNATTSKVPLVAGTLAETVAATSRWKDQRSSQNVDELLREAVLAKCASLLKHLENKLAEAKGKLKRTETTLAKVLGNQDPSEFPTDLETITDEERFLFRKIGLSMKPYFFLGRRGVYDGTIENMHLHWKYRELVKVIVKRKSFAQVKHVAVTLEAESGGVLVSIEPTMKGHAIIVYRGKNYQRPQEMRPKNLLSKRQALDRSIELQRREALKHHILDLMERIELVKLELEEMESGKKLDADKMRSMLDECSISDGEADEEGEESYLEGYASGNKSTYQN